MAKPKRICSVDGCDKPVRSSGLCGSHYFRQYRYGDPLLGGPPKTASGALREYIENTVLKYEGDECLPWPFSGNNKGYGQVRYNGRRWIASRLICVLVHGDPPHPDAETRHSCGNGHLGCVNPHHLEWGSRQDNVEDRGSHGTTARGERARHKLTEQEVRAIRQLQGTASLRQLAARFNISPTMVRYIQIRKSWAWLE